MKRILRSLGALILVAIASARPAEASAIVFSQPPGSGSYWRSEVLGVVPTFYTYDNFTLGATYDLVGVNWFGGYVDFSNSGAPAAIATSFEFRFYTDVAGQPGALLYTASTTSFTEALLGPGTIATFPASFFSYSASLPIAFTASAGTTYWLSIIAHVPGGPVSWTWGPSNVGDDIAYQELVSTGQRFLRDDRSFELIATPEPASLMLLGAGLGTLGLRLRRSRSRPNA